MVNYSLSITKGKGNQRHNNRTQLTVPAHVDQERIKDNLIFVDKDIREVYKSLFGSALEKYNAKQKRNDRKIKDYYSKIVHSKKEKAFHELIIQIGNKDEYPNDETLKEFYREFLENFQTKYSNLSVIGAYVHFDESTPHLHLDYVPFTTGSKRGLETRISHEKALKQMGYDDYKDFRNHLQQDIMLLTKQFNFGIKIMDNHEKHLNTADFKRYQQKVLDIQEECLVATKQKMKLKQENIELEKVIDTQKKEIISLKTKKNELNSVLEQEKTQIFTLKKKNLLFRIVDSIEWIMDEFIQWFNDEIYKWLDDDIQQQLDELDEEIQNDKGGYSL